MSEDFVAHFVYMNVLYKPKISSHQVAPYAKVSVEIDLKITAHLKVGTVFINLSLYYLLMYQRSVMDFEDIFLSSVQFTTATFKDFLPLFVSWKGER